MKHNPTIHKDSQGIAVVSYAQFGVSGALAKASFPAHL